MLTNEGGSKNCSACMSICLFACYVMLRFDKSWLLLSKSWNAFVLVGMYWYVVIRLDLSWNALVRLCMSWFVEKHLRYVLVHRDRRDMSWSVLVSPVMSWYVLQCLGTS